jgi:hypothetical protein
VNATHEFFWLRSDERILVCDSLDLRDSWALGLAEYFPGVSASFADRDLIFRSCPGLAGTGASAGSWHLDEAFE